MQPPKHSPWGSIQDCKKMADGVFSVSTAGHGGIMVCRSIFSHQMSDLAKAQGIDEGGEYIGFEEDCAWAFPVLELNLLDAERQEMARNTICYWYTEYAHNTPGFKNSLNDKQLENLEQRTLEAEQERVYESLKKENCPTLVVAAYRINNLSDYRTHLKIGGSESVDELIAELHKVGNLLKPEIVAESLQQESSALCFVWTADGKIHIVDRYPRGNTRKIITHLNECGNLIFTQN